MQSAQWITAARVLRRAGFGTTGTAVDSALTEADLATTVSGLYDYRFQDDVGANSTPVPSFKLGRQEIGASESERKEWLKKRNSEFREVTRWWLRRMVAADRPELEKLTFSWHNHFATNLGAVGNAKLMAEQNQTIRSLCLGDFRTLAYAMLTDGAMLRWLNGNSNTAESPNENLAREFLELFALGHGNGYTEQDVKEGARALTGWVVARDGATRFNPERHDSKTKTVLGVKAKHDASTFCDAVLEQPASARFIATQVWRSMVSDNPPSSGTLLQLVDAYGPTRNLKALTAASLTATEFLEGRTSVVSGPVDWLVGLLRALQVPLEDGGEREADVEKYLKLLGQLPFRPPSVGGWPRGRAWLSTGTAGVRIRAGLMAVEGGDVSLVADAAQSERIDAAAFLLGIGKWSDSSARALNKYLRDPVTLVVAAANSPEYLTT